MVMHYHFFPHILVRYGLLDRHRNKLCDLSLFHVFKFCDLSQMHVITSICLQHTQRALAIKNRLRAKKSG
jgi:hypothetical protein